MYSESNTSDTYQEWISKLVLEDEQWKSSWSWDSSWHDSWRDSWHASWHDSWQSSSQDWGANNQQDGWANSQQHASWDKQDQAANTGKFAGQGVYAQAATYFAGSTSSSSHEKVPTPPPAPPPAHLMQALHGHHEEGTALRQSLVAAIRMHMGEPEQPKGEKPEEHVEEVSMSSVSDEADTAKPVAESWDVDSEEYDPYVEPCMQLSDTEQLIQALAQQVEDANAASRWS